MRARSILLAAFLVAGCAASGAGPGDHEGEMTGEFSGEASSVLYVDPAGVGEAREEFAARLRLLGPKGDKRALYEEFVPKIGANGVLEGIHERWPKCHSEGHDLGKVIFAETKDIGASLRVCRDGCYSGCMHGVLMEAFAGARGAGAETDPEAHVDVELVKTMMNDICAEKTMTAAYSPGDCAHATGHALMALADYDVPAAIDYCDEFDSIHMRYYCATGAYMEYVTEHDAEDAAAGRRSLYPCDANKYPAACMRYKMVHVVRRLIKRKNDALRMATACRALPDPYRVACFHGMGNGFMGIVAGGTMNLAEVCTGSDEERAACIDGAMERMAKYHPARAEEVCGTLSYGSPSWQACEDARGRGMYDMDKDLTPYVTGWKRP